MAAFMRHVVGEGSSRLAVGLVYGGHRGSGVAAYIIAALSPSCGSERTSQEHAGYEQGEGFFEQVCYLPDSGVVLASLPHVEG
jgi:hypothetical protein